MLQRKEAKMRKTEKQKRRNRLIGVIVLVLVIAWGGEVIWVNQYYTRNTDGRRGSF